MTDHDDLRFLLGGYVLGGLDREDRHRVQQHLARCADCQAELVGFAPLPGLLHRAAQATDQATNRATDQATDRARPGDDLLPRLLDAVAHERGVRRRRAVVAGLGAAAAAVVVLAGFPLWGSPTGAPEPPGTVVALSGVDDARPRGEAQLLEKAWGTAVTLSAEQLPDDGPFTLQVTSADGTRQLAAAWGPTPAGRALVAGATSIPPDQISSLRVLGPDGTLLVGTPGAEIG